METGKCGMAWKGREGSVVGHGVWDSLFVGQRTLYYQQRKLHMQKQSKTCRKNSKKKVSIQMVKRVVSDIRSC